MEQNENTTNARQPENGAAEPSYSELVAVRREKLAALQQAGQDPFERTSWPRAITPSRSRTPLWIRPRASTARLSAWRAA